MTVKRSRTSRPDEWLKDVMVLHKRETGSARWAIRSGDETAAAAPLSAAWDAARLTPSPGPLAVQGTSGDDHLVGTTGPDHLEGLGGNDRLEGLAGDDLLEGGGNDDILLGGDDNDTIVELSGANDELYGEAGNDRLTYRSGTGAVTVLLDGGAGDDVLDARGALDDTVTLDGGSGSDRILVGFGLEVSVDAGDGADLVQVSSVYAQEITLGAGADLVAFDDLVWGQGVITIHDFTAGDGGDAINMVGLLYGSVPSAWTNPFGTGAIKLSQSGADASLEIDTDTISGPSTVWIFLRNVQASSLTAYNLGFAPDGSAGSALSLSGSAGVDFLTGRGVNDTILGNGGDDVLFGAAGNDQLVGGEGADALYGQFGNDMLEGGGGDDFIDIGIGFDIADGGDGIDGFSGNLAGTLGDTMLYWHLPQNSYSGPAGTGFTNFEWFGLLTTGGGNDIVITHDVARDDTLALGAGGDTAIVYNGHDSIYGGDDSDLLIVDYSASATALVSMNLSFDWDGVGVRGYYATLDGQRRVGFDSIERFQIVGTAFADTITILSQSASGLSGGGGDDQLIGSNGGDGLEGGTGDDRLYGNGSNDTLRGDQGDDLLVGGFGGDLMIGGTGNDIYFVDEYTPELNLMDRVDEYAGEGDDTVYASVSYTLSGAGGSVETLAAIAQGATTAIALTGSDAANSIFGNEGNNQLVGLGGNDQLVGYGGNDVLVGGAGIDYLRGGLGNDVYGIGEGDLIFELTGEGDDSLAADIGSYFLNVGASIETLSTANQAGTFAQNLTGNSFAQTIAGSEGANVLNGNLGNDLLRGYGGADIFLFDTAPGANNHDVIADMAVGVDKIALQNSVFTGLAEGNLGAEAFRVGTAAQDADDRIIWNAATNQLFFDADGNGAGAAVLFAIVNGAPNLQASDFIII